MEYFSGTQMECDRSITSTDGWMTVARDWAYTTNGERRVVKKYITFQDYNTFIREYDIARSSKKLFYMYWNEVMSCNGRIVLDFDVDVGTQEYDRICLQYPLDSGWYPTGYEKYLERIILAAFRMLDMHEIADQLSKDSVLWWKRPIYPGPNGMVQDDVYAPPFCWSSHCRSSKISLHVTLPIYVYDRHKLTGELLHAMASIHGGSIGDMAMAKERQGIRLPWMGKLTGKDPTHGEMKLHDMRHYPWCITSWVQSPYLFMPEMFIIKDWVPSPYRLDHTSTSGNATHIDESAIEELWAMVPEDITDMYEGIELVHDRWTLIPRNKDEWHCCVCNCIHTKFMPHLYAVEDNVYITCIRKPSHGGKAICIKGSGNKRPINMEQTRFLMQPMLGIPAGIKVSYMEGKRCAPFPSMDTWKTLMVCAEKGSGKTHQLGAFLKTVPMDVPICLISFRVALGSEAWRKLDLDALGFHWYQDHPYDRHRIVTTVESLHKWEYLDHHEGNAILIIDEYESMLDQLDASTNTNKIRTLYAFKRMVRVSSHVIVMDAGLTWNVGCNTLRLYGRGTKDMLVMWNKLPLQAYDDRTYYMYPDKGSWMSSIVAEPPGTKINIRCGSHAENITEEVSLARGIPDERRVCITGKSSNKADNVEDTYDKGGTALLCVVNSVHQAGNSYDKEYFDVLYTKGSGDTAGPLAIIQMEGRVRHHKRHDAHALMSNHTQPYYMLDPMEYHKHMDKWSQYDPSRLTSDEMNWRFILTPEDKLVLTRIRVRNAIGRHYMKEVYEWYHREVHEHEIIHVDIPRCKYVAPTISLSMPWKETSECIEADPKRNDEDIVKIIKPDETVSYRLEKYTTLVKEMKMYRRCIQNRGYTLSWKHAARFFKDQWHKGGMHVIKACVHGRIAMDEYEMKLEHCRRKGLPDSDAVPKDEEEIHTLSRYGLMQDLRSMAIQEYADGTHTWRFKASLRDDPAWKRLMDRYDSYFNTHLMRQGHCHRDMWKMLSGVVTRELCIMHTMVDERVVDGKDRSVWWVIRFNDDDALMDVG